MDETDGSRADETVHFGLDGAEFELNLSKAHAEELRRVLEPYIKAGRKTGSKRNGRAATNKDQAEPVLDGAKQHSMKVLDSGQLQRQIIGLNRRVNDQRWPTEVDIQLACESFPLVVGRLSSRPRANGEA